MVGSNDGDGSIADPRPKLAITIGDPAGIGPEVVLKALADPATRADFDITVVGSHILLDQAYTHLRQTRCLSVGTTGEGDHLPLVCPGDLDILDPEPDSVLAVNWGQPTVLSGQASFTYMTTAIAHTLAGEFQGIVTGPIAKSSWKQAGHEYAGQTELLAERAGVNQFGMLFVAESPHTQWSLITLLATTHIPLSQVPQQLTPALLSSKLDLLLTCLRQEFGLDCPSVAIAGLNPHSGEQGQLGREEVDWLVPWLGEMRSRYPRATLDGPIPPDTLWVEAGQAWYGAITPNQTQRARAHDAYLALYHDQGLIPVKLMAFDRAINTTIGLPFVRTSPDHGTAFDIAGQGIADATSMRAAIRLAGRLVRQRSHNVKNTDGAAPRSLDHITVNNSSSSLTPT